MAQIIAYHPELLVQCEDGSVAQISAELDDWYEDREVFSFLLGAYPGCKSMGDLVSAMKVRGGELFPGRDGLVSCRISEGVTNVGSPLGWEDLN
jgi:hypothetical protein